MTEKNSDKKLQQLHEINEWQKLLNRPQLNKSDMTMENTLEELNKEHERLLEKKRLDLIFEIMEMEKMGSKTSFDYRKETNIQKLEWELYRLKHKERITNEHELKVDVFKHLCMLMQTDVIANCFVKAIDQVVKDMPEKTSKRCKCLKCQVVSEISFKAKSVEGFIEKCMHCQNNTACVFQPQCGHVCLCTECFNKMA